MEVKTASARKSWWFSMSDSWKTALSQAYLNRPAMLQRPRDKDLKELLDAKVLRIVGPKGYHPSTDQVLDDLSPLAAMTNLEYLFVTQLELQSLKGIERLTSLKSLFINDNRITSIEEVTDLIDLKELYMQENRIRSIAPVKKLTRLETLYICTNDLTSLEGITPAHEKHLKNFYCIPNPGISFRQIKAVEEKLGIQCKMG